MTDRAHMPGAEGCSAMRLLEAESDAFEWPRSTRTPRAALLHLGHDRNPRARSTAIARRVHAYGLPADAMNLSGSDCALPVVPMFHANAGAAVRRAVVARRSSSRRALDGKSLHALFESERCRLRGVPTVWETHPVHEESGVRLSTLKRTSSGAPCPPAMIRASRTSSASR